MADYSHTQKRFMVERFLVMYTKIALYSNTSRVYMRKMEHVDRP